MQKKDRYIVIMAGGRGERFWPVSRERKPKQLITLLGNRSFLQQTVDRVKPIVPLENILIITNAGMTAAAATARILAVRAVSAARSKRSGSVERSVDAK